MLKPNGYVFNYVILATTLLIIIQCGTSLTCIGYEQVLLIPLCLIGFFFHQCIIHGPPHVNLACLLSSMGTSHLTVVQHRWQYYNSFFGPFPILFVWAFMGQLVAIYYPHSNYKRGLHCSICEKVSSTHTSFWHETTKGLPHTTMGSDTTCWGK